MASRTRTQPSTRVGGWPVALGPATLPAGPRDVRTRLMDVLRVLLARLPAPVGYLLADRLGDLIYHTARRSRRAAISNLGHVLTAYGRQVQRSQLEQAVRGVFRNVMRNYYDLVRASVMSDEEIDRMVDFDEQGWQCVLNYYNNRRGVILVTAHFGAFDVITHLINRRGLPVTFIISRVRPAWLSDFVSLLRARRGLRLLVVEEEGQDDQAGNAINLAALRQSVEMLRNASGVLGVVADRNTERRGTTIRFFGYNTVVATGVAKLALRTHAVVIPGFCQRLPHNRYRVTFDPPIEPAGSASNEADVKALLTSIFSSFERHISRNPDQWVLLQPVWPR